MRGQEMKLSYDPKGKVTASAKWASNAAKEFFDFDPVNPPMPVNIIGAFSTCKISDIYQTKDDPVGMMNFIKTPEAQKLYLEEALEKHKNESTDDNKQ